MAQLNFVTKIMVIALTLSLNLISTSQSTFSGWDFNCMTFNERHVHELFCFRYYQCTEDDVGNWIIELNSCPPGRIYNEVSGRCEDGQCPTEPPPCSRFSLGHDIFTGSTRDWDFQCHALKERYQHESYCNRFYECSEDDVGNWVIQVHSCPPGRIYDEAGGRCVDGSCPTASPPDCESESTDAVTPEPSTVQPEPSPSTMGPEPSTVRPEPSTVRPDPSTVKPEPSTIVTEPPMTTIASPGFKCTEEGVFPDPLDCKLSHTCIPTDGGFIDVPVRCPGEQNFCHDIKACGECPCSI